MVPVRGQQQQQRLRPAGLAGQVERQAIRRECQRKGGGEQGGKQPVKPALVFSAAAVAGRFSGGVGGCMFLTAYEFAAAGKAKFATGRRRWNAVRPECA
jgi:hypothetical protein